MLLFPLFVLINYCLQFVHANWTCALVKRCLSGLGHPSGSLKRGAVRMSGPERSGDSDIINEGLSDQLHMVHLPGGSRLLSAPVTVCFWIQFKGALLICSSKKYALFKSVTASALFVLFFQASGLQKHFFFFKAELPFVAFVSVSRYKRSEQGLVMKRRDC